ncbi:MAG: hypothetical protein ACUVXF_00960 [Desulfobaccales bacterium]
MIHKGSVFPFYLPSFFHYPAACQKGTKLLPTRVSVDPVFIPEKGQKGATSQTNSSSQKNYFFPLAAGVPGSYYSTTSNLKLVVTGDDTLVSFTSYNNLTVE